jgi:hypothetical protein
LEIGLFRHDATSYDVVLRFDQPGDQGGLAPDRGLVQFDFRRLTERRVDPDAYGQLLCDCLFGDQAVKDALESARRAAEVGDMKLRLRLLIDRSAAELHGLFWETLHDPRNGSWLLTSQDIVFSRYLTGGDWRPIRVRREAPLRALIAIANPADLADENQPQAPGRWSYPAIRVAEELNRAKAGLKGIPPEELQKNPDHPGLASILIEELVSDPAKPGQVTLDRLVEEMSGGVDILYLVCHGAMKRKVLQAVEEPSLWLEKEDGNSAVVAGRDLVDRVRDLPVRPRLVVLASCQSAGKGAEARTDDGGVLAGLGPQLAEAGVSAILAMQGDVTMETIARLSPIFFKELVLDGQIDRAAAAARDGVRDRDDRWAPALFLRLRYGRIWYEPGLHSGPGRLLFAGWATLLDRLRDGTYTPILGPGLLGSYLGSGREIARRWADTYHFPLASYQREDLPQVAQYLRTRQNDDDAPARQLTEYLRQRMLESHSGKLPDNLRQAPPLQQLAALLEAEGARQRQADADEPHRILARLPLPHYLTTNPDDLLAQALRESGKTPHVAACPWNSDMARTEIPYEGEPTVAEPLVYHLFGRISQPKSLVLAEDDYFDYLIGMTLNKGLIPSSILDALADSALLFLGFHLDDWNFRVLFRSIMSSPGLRLRRYPHVAVQINPEEDRFIDPERGREYLEMYFRSYLGHRFPGVEISIYWGSLQDFMEELRSRWNQRYGGVIRL